MFIYRDHERASSIEAPKKTLKAMRVPIEVVRVLMEVVRVSIEAAKVRRSKTVLVKVCVGLRRP